MADLENFLMTQTERQQNIDEIMRHVGKLSTETLEKVLELINAIKGENGWV